MQRYLATVSTVIAVALFAPLSEVKGQSSTKSVIAPLFRAPSTSLRNNAS